MIRTTQVFLHCTGTLDLSVLKMPFCQELPVSASSRPVSSALEATLRPRELSEQNLTTLKGGTADESSAGLGRR